MMRAFGEEAGKLKQQVSRHLGGENHEPVVPKQSLDSLSPSLNLPGGIQLKLSSDGVWNFEGKDAVSVERVKQLERTVARLENEVEELEGELSARDREDREAERVLRSRTHEHGEQWRLERKAADLRLNQAMRQNARLKFQNRILLAMGAIAQQDYQKLLGAARKLVLNRKKRTAVSAPVSLQSQKRIKETDHTFLETDLEAVQLQDEQLVRLENGGEVTAVKLNDFPAHKSLRSPHDSPCQFATPQARLAASSQSSSSRITTSISRYFDAADAPFALSTPSTTENINVPENGLRIAQPLAMTGNDICGQVDRVDEEKEKDAEIFLSGSDSERQELMLEGERAPDDQVNVGRYGRVWCGVEEGRLGRKGELSTTQSTSYLGDDLDMETEAECSQEGAFSDSSSVDSSLDEFTKEESSGPTSSNLRPCISRALFV